MTLSHQPVDLHRQALNKCTILRRPGAGRGRAWCTSAVLALAAVPPGRSLSLPNSQPLLFTPLLGQKARYRHKPRALLQILGEPRVVLDGCAGNKEPKTGNVVILTVSHHRAVTRSYEGRELLGATALTGKGSAPWAARRERAGLRSGLITMAQPCAVHLPEQHVAEPSSTCRESPARWPGLEQVAFVCTGTITAVTRPMELKPCR